MSGLKGFVRTPGSPVRERRNASALAGEPEFVGSGEVIQLTSEGVLTITLKADGGLENATGELSIKLDGGKLTLSASGLTVDESAVDHDALLNFAADEHVGHSGVSINPQAPLGGGGDITASRNITISIGAGLENNAGTLQVENADGASKGDIFVYDGSNYQRLPVGTNGQRLTANSATATGLEWQTP